MSIRRRLEDKGPKRLLALDGGGIRGALTIEVLAGIEATLREQHGRPELRLCDYFDYIAGTSTGAILATALALGKSTDELRNFYETSGPAMFDKSFALARFRSLFKHQALAAELKKVFGPDTTLGSDAIRTLLMIVLRNATTDSPWPLSNNPRALYNNTNDDQDNLKLPLWQLVRASTAAPVYFQPESIPIGKLEHLFVDGGVTMFNNPAFQLFLMATIEPFRLQWPTGADKLLLVSVGTGYAADANRNLSPDDMNMLFNAKSVPSALMAAALHQQDALCRIFGKCLSGARLDRELGDLCSTAAPGGQKLFSYVRYNAELTRTGLDALGLQDIRPADVQKLDSTEHIRELQRIGTKVAERSVKAEHFRGFELRP